MRSDANRDESAVATETHFFSSHTGARRHRVTFQLSDGQVGDTSVVGRVKTDCPSYSTRGAVGDLFTVLPHSDWCRVCAWTRPCLGLRLMTLFLLLLPKGPRKSASKNKGSSTSQGDTSCVNADIEVIAGRLEKLKSLCSLRRLHVVPLEGAGETATST